MCPWGTVRFFNGLLRVAALAFGILLTATVCDDARAQGPVRLENLTYRTGSRVDELVASLGDEDEFTRCAAAYELGRIGADGRKAEAELIDALGDDDSSVRSTAADSLLRLGVDAQVVRPLLEDRETRFAVVESLLSLRREAVLVVPAVIDIMREDKNTFDLDRLLQALNADLRGGLQRALFPALDDLDEARAQAAFQSIEAMGGLDLAAVPALIRLLDSPRRWARLSGAKLLQRVGPAAHRAEPALRALAKEADGELCLTAYAALVAIGTDEHAAPNLAMALADEDSKTRWLALRLLEELGPKAAGAALALRLAVTNEEPELEDDFRQRCAGALFDLGPAVAVPELIRGIEECRNEAVLRLAVSTLRGFGPAAASAVDALTRRLADVEAASTRVDLLRALESIGPAARAAIPAVLKELESGAASNRAAAAVALGRIGDENEELRHALALLVKDESNEVRMAAGVALLLLGADSAAVAPLLIELIQDQDPELCSQALSAVELAGPRAKAVAPKLVDALSFEGGVSMGFGSFPNSAKASGCLVAIGRDAVPRLVGALRHPNVRVRAAAAEALGLIGPNAKSAVEGLTKALDDGGVVMVHCGCMGWEQTVGQTAMRALGQIGPGAESAVPELVGRLERELPMQEIPGCSNASFLVEALGKIGKPARAAVPLLEKMLRTDGGDPESRPSGLAIAALARIEPASPAVIPELRRYLQHVRENSSAEFNSGSDFREVVEAIVTLGEPGRALIPDLAELWGKCPVVNASTRCEAAGGALRLDPRCQSALHYLQFMSRHPDSFARGEAQEELKRAQESGGWKVE